MKINLNQIIIFFFFLQILKKTVFFFLSFLKKKPPPFWWYVEEPKGWRSSKIYVENYKRPSKRISKFPSYQSYHIIFSQILYHLIMEMYKKKKRQCDFETHELPKLKIEVNTTIIIIINLIWIPKQNDITVKTKWEDYSWINIEIVEI